MALNLPVQAVVNRAIPFDMYLTSRKIVDENGKVVEIVKNPVDGPFGSMPGDPGWFSRAVDPRLGVCRVLSRYAVPHCLHGRGYF